MATLEAALEIAARAHAGMLDRQGQPYILHCLNVMQGVTEPAARIVGVLHDVVEDTDVTIDDLRQAGFDETILTAVELMTHQKDQQSYADYVVRCRQNPLARQVKLADLRQNANLDRVLLRPESFEKDSARLHKYVLSYRYLTDQLSEADYRQLIAPFDHSPKDSGN